MGDFRTTVDEYVDKYANHNVFITALNTKFNSIGTNWLKNSYIIYKLNKFSPTNTDNSKVKNAAIREIEILQKNINRS